MTAPVFLVPPDSLAAGDRLAGSPLLLDGVEGHHAARVRRVRPGERVDVTDGAGRIAECVVTEVTGGGVRLTVGATFAVPPPAPRVVVVQALPKGERGELAVEMLTEVGVDAIVPWAAARCVTQWRGPRGERSRERWVAHAREATKQARRPWLPEVRPLASTGDVASLLSGAALGVVLHESAGEPLAAAPVPTDGDVLLVVGPEGGVTDEELAAFRSAGARVCRLGPSVLRASTAGTAAAAVVLANSGRWR